MKFEQAIVGIGLLSVMGLPIFAEASDSKSITLKKIGRYSGLERTGGVMVYDISKPSSPKFATYINTAPTDLSPEGLFFIKEEDSPNGKPLLVVSHEVSNTVTIFEIVKD